MYEYQLERLQYFGILQKEIKKTGLDNDSAGYMLIADQQISDDDPTLMIRVEPNKHDSQIVAGINNPAALEIYEEGHDNFKHILSFGQKLRAQDVPPYHHSLGQIHWTERDTFSYLAATKALAGPLLYDAIAAISIYSQSSVQDRDNKLIAAETACSKILGIHGYIHKNCDQQREIG
ncbi:MAG: hypothetical protein EZS28_041824 [Streblomastix strix]|uniref:Uncharacterized protein n=1 Tax=Streblomastix strix TaxID=222440 RepID=A0A5J4TXP2_9EUKA|nr:MAG: hypothetical protein EZS28_041824 [Streblomastix strix]